MFVTRTFFNLYLLCLFHLDYVLSIVFGVQGDKKNLGQLSEENKGKKMKKEAKTARVVFSEDCELIWQHGIIDPTGPIARRWNKLFLAACIVSLFIDPLFLLVPEVRPAFCIANGISLEVNLTTIRSVADMVYLINIFVQFRTAYMEPSSRVFGRGELVLDPSKIALRYLRFSFWIDLAAALPLPQIYFWEVLPKIRGVLISDDKTGLRFVTLIQFLLRLVLAYPLSMQIARVTGVISRRAWVGAAYNLLFIMLSSNVSGCCWYLLGIQRQLACWRSLCSENSTTCEYGYFDCGIILKQERNAWIQSSNISTICQPTADYYQFGIYSILVSPPATSAPFFHKFLYTLWWGLQNISSLGQNLITSIYIGENWFSMMVVTLGLVNYALLIGNLQRYLLSATARLDECTLQRNDTEQWMHHRQLPRDLRQCIRHYDRYKWVTTRGVDEEGLLREFPPDLRRQIKRHLCLDLVRRVPLFKQMDDRLVDAICERLKPILFTEGTQLLSEGDPLAEMLFIVRGHLYSCTTGGGRVGFFSSSEVGPGEFFGEELLLWALEPTPSDGPQPISLPSYTWTVKAITDVEAFTLEADHLRSAALQFRRALHSREVRHTLRCYSHQWRLWAACYIQAAWRRYKKRKMLGELQEKESITGSSSVYEEMEVFVPRPGSGMAVYAARLMADIRRGSSNRFGPDSYVLKSLY